MRYLRMQRSLRLKRRPQRPPEPSSEAQREAAPERSSATTPIAPRRESEANHH